MRFIPSRCPICQAEMTITRLHCSSCDTTLEGRFASNQLTNLSSDQLDFILTFVRCEGKLNRIEMEEKERWGSYPTIRNRLLEVIRALGRQFPVAHWVFKLSQYSPSLHRAAARLTRALRIDRWQISINLGDQMACVARKK